MSTITIHAEDCIVVALREHADKVGKSVNMAAKEILAAALGLVQKPKRRPPSFMKCAGTLPHEAAEELRAACGLRRRHWSEALNSVPLTAVSRISPCCNS